jgi:Na+/H+-translocating membrane pyrophosphatase
MSVSIYIFVTLSGIVGIAWAIYNYMKLKEIDLGGEAHDEEIKQPLNSKHPGVVEIGMIIKEGANAFIWSEYKICFVFIILMGAVVFFCVDQAKTWYTTIAFVVGAITSMFCGAFGMKIATFSNYRTTISAKNSLGQAFKTAYRAGCVMGFTLVSISMLVLLLLIVVYKNHLKIESMSI